MTMEVEEDPEELPQVSFDQILNALVIREDVCFKSQQIGESDLTIQEKRDIGLNIYSKSKLNFLIRFGKYLQEQHLIFFKQFENSDSPEIALILRDLLGVAKVDRQINVKNRRYEALKKMIKEDSLYFSEIEMMKRNPLLYEQLVGQYLTEDEKMERDRIEMGEEATLVRVLMEGIERDDAKIKKQQQETLENQSMEEEEDEDEQDDDDDKEEAQHFYENKPSTSSSTFSQWGEFDNEQVTKTFKSPKIKNITAQEQRLLKEEFITSMYQSFLEGRDEDFDYENVDNCADFDNLETQQCDEEEKYFDSEEPETVEEEIIKNGSKEESSESEDELDIYMSALNSNPAVKQLSENIQRL